MWIVIIIKMKIAVFKVFKLKLSNKQKKILLCFQNNPINAYILIVSKKHKALNFETKFYKEEFVMAVNKILNTTSFSMEVESGTDKTGAKVYKKKTFSGVKNTAPSENIFAVAEAIKSVLSNGTRDYYLTEASKITNA